ncbi:YeeE/YedE thiosulfate transporter family protein [Alkaliphilus hydrothermalis]|uniref:Membrane protein YedE/YeeE n=1 Tax=Alkaliphilus hydrothermalis TaxID=1482730 RepID=A0ABS2NRH1_9FIRM|nr:YeeE/YedE thiosulfate transporter family protein [Alkaliphilus hydrothermalis]MBM7615174.1 putative membrane protein YedE/YeeE [Alkaliphilus hydrothermalis]
MKIYNKIFKNPWSYRTGAVMLATLNILLFYKTGRMWRVTNGIVSIGAYILEKIGLEPSKWYYFTTYKNIDIKTGETFLSNPYILLNLAIILGALISVLLASEFKWKKIKSKKQFGFALLGGIMMGYGTRLSFGCNIGGYFSAIPSFSLHGWVFALFMFVGAWVGSKILVKFLLD